jgi:hypothetical protein
VPDTLGESVRVAVASGEADAPPLAEGHTLTLGVPLGASGEPEPE